VASTREFFQDTNSEMKKVTWPTRNEVVGTTVVVLVSTIVFALFLWGCDVVFYKAIDFLFTRFGAST
jgi:preprotein translocase subunit SecE